MATYREHMRRAWERINSFPTHRVETRFGTIEYADQREGMPLLVCHGILGCHVDTVDPGSPTTGWWMSLTPVVWIRTLWAATGAIDDYAERAAQTVAAWSRMNGQQGGDPAKLAAALVTVTQQDNPPLRWIAGADAIATVEQKAKDLLAQVDAYRLAQVDAYRELSSNLAHDDA